MPYERTFQNTFTVELIVASAVFVFITTLLVFALVRYRASNERPIGKAKHTVLEGSAVALLIGAAAAITGLSITANDHENTPLKASQRIDVTAFQWCWRFDYPQRHVVVKGTCGPHGTVPTMVVPVGRAVQIDVTSSDVVHEFSIPALSYRTFALPDHTNRFTITLTSAGTWIGRCSEFCGTYHAYMLFRLEAVSSSRYAHWLSAHAT